MLLTRSLKRFLGSNYSISPFIGLSSFHSSKNMSDKFALAQKYKGLEDNVWVEFIQLALEHKPLNLGQGLPDDLIPHYVLDSLKDVCMNPGPGAVLHQYTRGFGHPKLIQVLSEMYQELLQHSVDPLDEVLVTVGAYEALYCAITSHINPGDEVIIIEPYFDCYEPMVRFAGGIPKFISLAPTKTEGVISSGDWKLNPSELASMFNPKVKAIIFNNPNNPLGKVYTRDEIQMIADLCIQHNVLVISDDVYEHMTYDREMIRVATLPGMWDRTITIGSVGKTFSVTGWKLGWAIGPRQLIRNCQIAHQNCIYTCPTALQEAVSHCFKLEMSRFNTPDCYFTSIASDLKKKRDYIANVLLEVGMNPVIPEGGYFIMADWSKLAHKADLNSESDKRMDYRFVKWLCKNKKLQGIPPSAFFSEDHKQIGESYIRFCFMKHDDSLKKAEDILRNWIHG